MDPIQNQTPPPLTAPELPKQPELKIGRQLMVKHPSLNGQWQVAQVVGDPTAGDNPLIQFPDGSRYDPKDLQIGGPIETSLPGNTLVAGQTAEVSPLNPEYEAFRQTITQLTADSMRLFGMPLGPLTVMISRIAVERELEGRGRMGNYAGVQMFVPDSQTYDDWVVNYLLEIQRREAGRNAE